MPLTKPLILEPLGLITDPSKLGQYPDGALAVSLGVVYRSAGSHEAAPKFVETLTLEADTGSFEAAEIIPLPTGYTLVLAKRAGAWRYCWIDASNTPSDWAAATCAYSEAVSFEIDNRVSWMLARDRVFVCTDVGPMVFDYLAPTTAAERAPRLAGMFAPAISTEAIAETGAGALHAGQQAHTVAVITRHFPDCYEVTGPPSAAAQTFAPGDYEEDAEADRRNISITIYQRPDHPQYLPGDMVEVYRTYQTRRPAPGETAEDYEQGISTTAEYFMSSTFTIPDPALDSHTWEEATGDQNLGEALYTNATVVGASSQKRPPPIARVVEEFRGYTFYFDITEPPARVARAAGGMGNLTDDWSSAWGVGTRDEEVDDVEVNGEQFPLGQADDLASQTVCNVDNLARVNPDTPGEWTQPATGIAFRFDYAAAGDFTIRASNGQNYQPPLPTLSETAELVTRPRRKNGMMWTENGQPEAVVAAGLVGKTGQVYGACATSQAMVIWTEHGIHRLSGTGGSSSAGFDWALDQIDTQVLLRGPKAYGKLGDLVFCASNIGCVVIDGGGNVREISTTALGNVGKAKWSATDKTRVTPDEATGDVHFNFDGDPFTYTYSTRFNKWSRIRVADTEVACTVGNLQTEVTVAEIAGAELIVRRKSPTVRQQSVVRFQPVFDGDPASMKRWSEVEWFFAGDCEGEEMTILVNKMEGMTRDLDPYDAEDVPSFVQTGIDTSYQGDPEDFALAQTWMEVPRDAPAVNNSISLGYTTPEGTCSYKFFGASIICNHYTTTIRRAKGTT